MKTLVLGDPHGGHKSMLQCFERSGFDRERDELIVLGDVADGWPEVRQCFDELLTVKNLIFIIGNHDKWLLDWYKTGENELLWISQGGWNTLRSYNFEKPPKEHMDMLENAYLWMVDEERNVILLHGGFNPSKAIESHSAREIMWDRDLIKLAKKIESRERMRAYDTGEKFISPQIGIWNNSLRNKHYYDDIFVGHTTTNLFGTIDPVHYCNVWDLDTGGGWNGKLTIMDIDTKEYWQSDLVSDLYPDNQGRRDFNLDDPEVRTWLQKVEVIK